MSRKNATQKAHALSARAQWCTSTSFTPVDLPELRLAHGPNVRQATSASTTPIPVNEDGEFVDSNTADGHWLSPPAGPNHCLGFKTKGPLIPSPSPAWPTRFLDRPVEPTASNASRFVASGLLRFPLHDAETHQAHKAYVPAISRRPRPTPIAGAPTSPAAIRPSVTVPARKSRSFSKRMRPASFPMARGSLRSKIDIASPNIGGANPLLTASRHVAHHPRWRQMCSYPRYDYGPTASRLPEASLTALHASEFVITARSMIGYWRSGPSPPRVWPHQYDSPILVPGYTLVFEAQALSLVTERSVSGWDDPRCPRFPASAAAASRPALRSFLIGVVVTNSTAYRHRGLVHTVPPKSSTPGERRLAS